ncbi:MupA/Atu3671 family FMN-dependent luciferase-like monooxygenase [Myxococcus sp. RHSTA-1-4]|uniref:MupA/Atu3671 family FMN-dependent luciferase-like monooxygenase n=1 Tax=Myxococcus sp. RHSTA-1-4 TaxID=2874601 RepID=UPI001CBEE41B|nr:MupA/Atu3671 family FMN-dependent luciferase-like monooxygenase [Myxococcus sp. RHSTA-1-4]MBZ4420615.1 LLM class flavin-dependent oxidoreductase [Myxococcus sp. RHSTA-1-4]
MSAAGESPSCFIIGEGTLVVPCAQALMERGVRVLGLVTREPSLQKWAEEQGVPHVPPGEQVLPFLSRAPFDWLFSIVNLSMVKDEVLRLPRRMAINFHDGPLPRYAGLNVTSWALLHRETQHGVTWHEMTSGADKGRILKQRLFDIAPNETAFSLNARCYTLGMETFAELAAELVEGRVEPVEQDFSLRSYFGLAQRPEAAALLDTHGDVEEARALVAALDYGGYPNPLAFAKLWLGSAPVAISEARRVEEGSGASPGSIVSIEGDALTLAFEGGDLTLKGPKGQCGAPLSWAELLGSRNLAVGDALPPAPPELRARLSEVGPVAGKAENFFLHRLETLAPPDLPFLGGSAKEEGTHTVTLAAADIAAGWASDLPADERLLFTAAAFLSRLSPEPRFDVGFSDASTRARIQGAEGFFASQLPLRLELPMKEAPAAAAAAFRKGLTQLREKGAMARDVLGRSPQLSGLPRHNGEVAYPVALRISSAGELSHMVPGAALTVSVDADGSKAHLIFDAARVEKGRVSELSRQLSAFLASLQEAPAKPVGEHDLLGAEERKLLALWNDTRRELPKDATIHGLFRAQAQRTPDATALVCRGKTLTYRELDERSDVLARHLRGVGVGRDVRVGIFMERSLEMMVGVLAAHKAGGCYVPLDPAYPAERIAFMVEDAGCHLVLTQERLLARVPKAAQRVLAVDAAWEQIAASADVQTPPGGPDSLAYVIYTSGSTGKPKGVMIEHRNFVNFGIGMDERLGTERGTWLAVTSLNFDISVLELLWTLTRGFTVVIHAERHGAAREGQHASRAMDFSLFYFSSDEGERPEGRYDLLMESARFADTNGFCAVWTPERHFHAFGGLFPNPAVTSAALAAITRNVQLRAGSLVSPLHPTLRIAEDWSVVDNISHGRAGISFAAGWQPNDFALRPENFPDRKRIMFQQIEDVRRLWRGEALEVKSGSGNMVKVRTLPRPVQKEVPIWVTTAGNPETFEEAARAGCHVLTHLLGQTVEEVAQKIALYRETWAKCGHPGKGTVSLMLHTFVGESEAAVKEVVRGPMKAYLKSSVGLIKEAAWSFPAFKAQTTLSNGNFGTDHLSAEEMDALLDFSFERYFQTSGLFGSVDFCVAMVDRLKGLDIDEIACLVDFGVPTELVMKHLPLLAEVRKRANASVGLKPVDDGAEVDGSVPALLERHPVTHLQCTPSQASMLLAEERAREGLKRLKKMMVGGEAFPVPLARQLSETVSGDVVNMYGPTETTIWSSTHVVRNVGDSVPIGTPIANTQLYVLDAQKRPLPIGATGELYIGGAGVVRGYHQRPELNQERFVADPFSPQPGARMYRTGDAARWRQDGVVEFIGRLDHQVKVRGFRIELGEIEARLGEHPSVRETVVVVREDTPGDKRLVAYLIAKPGEPPAADALRDFLRARLPEYMVPQAFVTMSAFPQTPNKKVDRKALPPPEQAQARGAFTQPESETESLIAGIWQEVLKLDKVGVEDKFADLGGHSLLMVQVLDKLKTKVERPLTLVDLFRYPTVRALSTFISGDSGEDEALKEVAARGEARAAARRNMQRRRR